MRLILNFLCLLCGVTVVSGALHNVTVLENRILVECNRYYDDVRLGKCLENAAISWDSIDDQYPFELVKQAYDADGLSGLSLECERVCAATNQCRAYRVSSATDILQGNAICDIYTECNVANIVSAASKLYVKQAPFNCFIKATNFDGVKKNYNDLVNPWSQISRVLTVPIKPYQEIHIQVNGVTDLNTYAYRPYNELGEYCDLDDVFDCLLTENVILTSIIFVMLVGIISSNLILVLSKKNLIN